MMLIRSVASLLGLALMTSAQKCSVTQERDPGQVETVPCVFPFTYKVETFMTCTARDQPGGQEWCSTKVRLILCLPAAKSGQFVFFCQTLGKKFQLE